MSKVKCRDMGEGDLDAVWPLLAQLGYDISLAQLKQRFDAVRAAEEHLLLVAERDGQIAGFLHAFARPALEKPPEAVVQAMAVDQKLRRAGAGRALMAAVEGWAREQGFSSVALSSQLERSDAHAFYTRLGFERVATSGLFRKTF